MLASCEVKQGRTDGDRWAEDFIETYIDNRSFFFFCGHPFSPFAHQLQVKCIIIRLSPFLYEKEKCRRRNCIRHDRFDIRVVNMSPNLICKDDMNNMNNMKTQFSSAAHETEQWLVTAPGLVIMTTYIPLYQLAHYLITYPTTPDLARSAVLSPHYPAPPSRSSLPLHSQAHTPLSYHLPTTSPSHLHKTVSPYLPHHPNQNPAPATHPALARGR